MLSEIVGDLRSSDFDETTLFAAGDESTLGATSPRISSLNRKSPLPQVLEALSTATPSLDGASMALANQNLLGYLEFRSTSAFTTCE